MCLYLGNEGVVVGELVMDFIYKLSENIWFVWPRVSYSGDIEGCHACPRTTTNDGK